MTLQKPMATTKISKASNGQVRATLPRALVNALDFSDRQDHYAHFEVECAGDDEIAYVVTIGPDVDESLTNSLSPNIRSTGQVVLSLPAFQTEAWNLVDTHIEWPDADELVIEDDGTVEIHAGIVEWEPHHAVDSVFSGSGFKRSPINETGTDQTTVITYFPQKPANVVGLAEPKARAEISFDCVDGRVVIVATPTDKPRSELRNSVTVSMRGPNHNQPQFSAKQLASELGVVGQLEDRSVRLNWFERGARQLVGFVDESGGGQNE